MLACRHTVSAVRRLGGTCQCRPPGRWEHWLCFLVASCHRSLVPATNVNPRHPCQYRTRAIAAQHLAGGPPQLVAVLMGTLLPYQCANPTQVADLNQLAIDDEAAAAEAEAQDGIPGYCGDRALRAYAGGQYCSKFDR